MPEKTSCLMSSIINDEKMDTETQEKKIPNLTKVSKNKMPQNIRNFREYNFQNLHNQQHV